MAAKDRGGLRACNASLFRKVEVCMTHIFAKITNMRLEAVVKKQRLQRNTRETCVEEIADTRKTRGASDKREQLDEEGMR